MSETYEQEQERLVRETENREWDFFEGLRMGALWRQLSKKGQAMRAGSPEWIENYKEGRKMIEKIVELWGMDEHKVVLRLIEDVK